MEEYDFIIVGGGCAGYPAAVYASRYNMKTLVITKERGGLITTTHLVENYPGFTSLTGPELAQHLEDHVKANNVPIEDDIVSEIRKEGKYFIVKTAIQEKEFKAKTILLATGSHHKHLGLESEEKFQGKGVSYCATCDGMFFKEKQVAIVGGGDSAAKEAMVLAQNSSKVYMLVRSKLRAEPINVDRIENNPKIEIIYGVNVKEILGEKNVERVLLDNGKELNVSAVFVSIGMVPQSELAESLGVELNDSKEVIINRESKTNVPGIFAAGDVTNTTWKQAIISAGEGSFAAESAHDYISKNF
ncbi:MAG: NAD(P)/FAD-dependent oxidoreductase [Nanoarchaeota archaeon]